MILVEEHHYLIYSLVDRGSYFFKIWFDFFVQKHFNLCGLFIGKILLVEVFNTFEYNE